MPDEAWSPRRLDENGGPYQVARHLRLIGDRADMLRDDSRPYLFLRDESRMVLLNDDSEACKAEIRKWGCFRDGNAYVNDGRGGMFKITPESVEEVPNGADGVYMHDPEAMPWPRLGESKQKLEEIAGSLGNYGMKAADTLLCRYLNAFFEPQTLRPGQFGSFSLRGTWPSSFAGPSTCFPSA